MKKLFKLLKNWFYRLFETTEQRIERKLKESAKEVLLLRYELKKEISKDLHKAFGISFSKKSKYIPSKGHNKTKLYMYIQDKYGKQMTNVSLDLTTNLHWK